MPFDTAFSLAGLGGFNAHGAGFLTAARDLGAVLDLVTATSGQIIVLGEWLRSPKADLKALLIDPTRLSGPLGTLLTAFTGDPGIFRPATQEYWRRWSEWPKGPADWAAKLFPAQEYVPLRSEAYLDSIAGLLNGAPFGVFNAYAPKNGRGDPLRQPCRRGALGRQVRWRRSRRRRSPRRCGCRSTGLTGFPEALWTALTIAPASSPNCIRSSGSSSPGRSRGGLARKGAGELVRRAGLAMRDVVFRSATRRKSPT